MLQDIIDEYDMENNFEYLLGRYIMFLERDGRWKHSGDPRAKIQFKSRLKKLNEEGETEGREYKKMAEWVQKQMFREQKMTEKNCFKTELSNQRNLLNEAYANQREVGNKLQSLAFDSNEESDFMKTSRAEDVAKEELHKVDMELIIMIDERLKKLQKDYDDLLNKYILECDSDEEV